MLSILNSKQRRNFYILFVIMFIGAFVELLGVGLVMPLVNVVSDASIISTDKYVLCGIKCTGLCIILCSSVNHNIYYEKFLFNSRV